LQSSYQSDIHNTFSLPLPLVIPD